MSQVICPECGKCLEVPEGSESVLVQCPVCRRSFQLTRDPVPENQIEYVEEGMGWFAKGALGALALAGTFLLIFLIVKIVGQSSNSDTQVASETQPAASSSKSVFDELRDKMAGKPSPASPDKTKDAPVPPKPKPVLPKPSPTPSAGGREYSPTELFARVSPAVVRVLVRDGNFKLIGQGSGFFVSDDGYLVTNYHVIEGAKFASVLLASGESLFVDGVAAHDAHEKVDLAILKVNGSDLPFLTLASSMPAIGSKVYAIGNPLGLTNTLTEGLVSAHRTSDAKLPTLQTSAPLSHGSSGGPLLTSDGKVVGVTTRKSPAEAQNLNFAVPSTDVHRLMRGRGKLRKLASVGGTRLDQTITAELRKALDAMDKGDRQTAVRILTKLQTTQSGNAYVWLTLGMLHGELENHEAALRHYKKAVALKPDLFAAHYFIGDHHYELDQYEEAIAAFKKAKALRPDVADSYYGMGRTYFKMKRYLDAINAFKKVIELRPDYAGAYYGIGLAYDGLKSYKDALASLQKAVAVQPRSSAGYHWLGRVHGKLRQYAEAVVAHQTAVALQPTDPGLVLWLGNAYEEARQYREALQAYERVKLLDPGGKAAKVASDRITSLRRRLGSR